MSRIPWIGQISSILHPVVMILRRGTDTVQSIFASIRRVNAVSKVAGTRTALAMIGTLALVGGCAATGAPQDAPEAQSTRSSSPGTPEPSSPTPEPTPTPSPEPTPTNCGDGSTADPDCQVVPAEANIFGAGHEDPPAPGEGGAGVLPPVWEVPAEARTLQVIETVGEVWAVAELAPNDAEGRSGPTGIGSWEGISGILHDTRSMFLVGVFLTDAPPGDSAPERLDFTNREDYGELAPEIGQTFYIGDGHGRTVVVPEGATRLFLGFADAYLFVGLPGWYGNNSGQLAVTVAFGE